MCLFRECQPVPLVYVLGNTIWPQVPSIYLKPSVSFPVLIASRVSSRFCSPLIICRRCLERSRRKIWRGRKQAKTQPEPRKTKTDGVNERGEGREWHSPLNLTPSCGFNERWGESRDGRQTRQECLCCSLANEKKQWQIYVSQEGPQICDVTPPTHQMFWLLINSPGFLTCTNMLVFIHRYMLICFIRCSMWLHAHMNLLKGNKQAVCLYLWCAGMQSIMQSLYKRITFETAVLMGSSGVVCLADRGRLQLKQRW